MGIKRVLITSNKTLFTSVHASTDSVLWFWNSSKKKYTWTQRLLTTVLYYFHLWSGVGLIKTITLS